MWRNRFGGGFGPVVRQNTEGMNEQPSYELQNQFRRHVSTSIYQLIFGTEYMKNHQNIKIFV